MFPILRHSIQWILRIARDEATYVFSITTAYYLFVFFFNQTNKTLLAATVILAIVFWRRFKKIDISVFLIFLISIAFPVGKTHEFELLPPGVIQSEYFSDGLFAQVVIGISDICVFLMTFLMIRDIYHKKFFLPFTWPTIYLFLYVLIGIISSLIMARLPDLSFIWAIQSMGILIAMLFFINLSRQIKVIPFLLSFCAALLVFEAIVAGGQFIRNNYLGSSIESTAYKFAGTSVDEDVFTFRSLGTFTHPNILAQTSIFLLPIFIALLYMPVPPIKKSLITLSIFAGTFSLFVSQGRTAWLIFGAGFVCMMYILEKKWRLAFRLGFSKKIIIIGIILLTFLFLIIVPTRLASLMYSFEQEAGGTTRLLLMKEWVTLIVRYPLLGVGPGMSILEGFYQNTTGVLTSFPEAVHNVYLIIGAERGIFGLVAFLAYIIFTSQQLLRSVFRKKPHPDRILFLGILCGSFCIYINFLFQPYLDTMLFAVLFHSLLRI